MSFNSTTTRLPGGATNAAPWQTMGNSGVPDPSWAHIYHDDFDKYTATDWTITLTGAGTNALAASSDGGQLQSVTTTAINDAVLTQPKYPTFQIYGAAIQKSSYFKWSGTISDALNSTLFFGWIGATTPLTPTDGIYISSPSGGAGLNLVLVKASVVTTIPFPASCVIVNGVNFEVGIEVDYLGNVAGYFNPTTGNNGTLSQFNTIGGRGRVVSVLAPTLTTAFFAPTFGVKTATAAAKTLTTDFVTAVKER